MQYRITFLLLLTFVTCNSVLSQDASREYTIRIDKKTVALEPETESFALNKGDIAFQTDLNNDGHQDLIIAFGNCGNWGDCIYGFFIASSSGTYQCVFEEYLPSFSIAETTTTHNGVKWKDISVTERSQDKDGKPVAVTKKLFFNGEVYTMK
jgi:hypothetical protein